MTATSPLDPKMHSTELIRSLVAFVRDGGKNAWLITECRPLSEIYVRRGLRPNYTERGSMIDTLDVANIQIAEDVVGNGVFTKFLDAAEASGVEQVYVENVLEPRLESFLRRRGYELTHGTHYSPCYFKIVGGSRERKV